MNYDAKVKKLHMDGSSEFHTTKFKSFLKSKRTSLILSTSYTPLQNGLAERAKQLIITKARYMLQCAGLSPGYGKHAVSRIRLKQDTDLCG